ncbi:hypothetical protein B484DRAFT_416800 [Ochromonadaceae sp. CCMP2298]|nr:hypothetical protein B484DRAFT_416800 [Ochromonadaceae sp. CCMP2298]
MDGGGGMGGMGVESLAQSKQRRRHREAFYSQQMQCIAGVEYGARSGAGAGAWSGAGAGGGTDYGYGNWAGAGTSASKSTITSTSTSVVTSAGAGVGRVRSLSHLCIATAARYAPLYAPADLQFVLSCLPAHHTRLFSLLCAYHNTVSDELASLMAHDHLDCVYLGQQITDVGVRRLANSAEQAGLTKFAELDSWESIHASDVDFALSGCQAGSK